MTPLEEKIEEIFKEAGWVKPVHCERCKYWRRISPYAETGECMQARGKSPLNFVKSDQWCDEGRKSDESNHVDGSTN